MANSNAHTPGSSVTGFSGSSSKPAIIATPTGGKSIATVPSTDTGRKPGTAVKGFTGSGVIPGKV